MINKSASLVGHLIWNNGNTLSIWTDCNGNTGEPILWQEYELGTNRFTGKNIRKFMVELNDALNEGELKWVGEVNDAALNALAGV